MANHSTARWETFQYALDELMAKPEFKHKPSPALMTYLNNTDFLIPASAKEAALGVKQTDQDTVDVNLINRQSITTGSARAAAHTGSKNDSRKTTVTFTTYTADFTYSIKEAGRLIWQQAPLVAAQLQSAAIALHDTIETAALARLNTNKSQVVTSLTPREGTWDATNYIYQITNNDSDRWMQRVKGFMRQQYYKGLYDSIIDETLFQTAEHFINQGSANSENLSYQANGINFDNSLTQELSLDSGYVGMGYIFPVGTVGVLPWIPKENKEGRGEAGEIGGAYQTITDPLGSGLQFAVHERYLAADNESNSGETQDIDVHVELSVDLGFVEADTSTANESSIFKFGVQQ